MAPVRIVVVGSANMDIVMRTRRLPKPGETLIAQVFMTAHGGKGANQAVAAARLGARVSFVGAVGADAFGAIQRDGLAREGMDLTHLKTDTEQATGVAQIVIADTGDNMIVVAPNANHGLLPADIAGLRACFEAADVVITQLETPLETVEAVLRLARDCDLFSILDIGSAMKVPAALIACADLVSPNETEAEAITGVVVDTADTARDAGERLLAMGARHVVMKLGARGCLYLGEATVPMPAFPVKAVDATAAGDAFTAALGVAWHRLPRADALRFANAAGALAATVAGAQPSMSTRAAVLQFLRDHGCTIDLQ